MARQILQKLLARAGVASRRKSEALIREGRVAVDGRVAVLGESADPATQTITVDGKPIHLPTAFQYLALNKPRGYLTSRSDPHHDRFVYDLLPPRLRALVFPVGRLDRDSEGLLIMTSDGELAHRLMHPRYRVPRVYHVSVTGPGEAVALLRRGVDLAEGPARPDRVRVRKTQGDNRELEVVLLEGRKREVRRMCAVAGLTVRRLRREVYGPIRLGSLATGRWRRLEDHEVDALRRSVGLTNPQ